MDVWMACMQWTGPFFLTTTVPWGYSEALSVGVCAARMCCVSCCSNTSFPLSMCVRQPSADVTLCVYMPPSHCS